MIIFDKDHTLVRPASGGVWVQDPTDQTPLIPVATIAALAQEHDLYIASNQGGVAAGHKTMDEAIAEMRYCLKLFPSIKYALFAPNYEGDICVKVTRSSHKIVKGKGFRKPDGGMIRLIANGRDCIHAAIASSLFSQPISVATR